MGAGRCDVAGLAMVGVLGPCLGREERLVEHEVGFAVEQIVHAAVVSLDERPRVIHEGQIDALIFFPPAFIFQGHPVVLRGVQESVRLFVLLRDVNVFIPNDFVIVIQPLEHGALHGQVVHDRRVTCRRISDTGLQKGPLTRRASSSSHFAVSPYERGREST